jgi:hypothetical protein
MNIKNETATPLSSAEVAVLRVFRQFLMSTGQMLCFYGNDLDRYCAALKNLTSQRMLQAERFPGGYSLTASGFEAMQSL